MAGNTYNPYDAGNKIHSREENVRKPIEVSYKPPAPKTRVTASFSSASGRTVDRAAGKAKEALKAQDDLGGATASSMITTAQTTKTVWQGAQTVSNVVVKAGNTTYHAVKAVGNIGVIRNIRTGTVVVMRDVTTGLDKLKKAGSAVKARTGKIMTGVGRGIRSGGGKIHTAVGSSAVDTLAKSEDMGLQTAALGIKSARYTVKTTKTAGKVAYKTIKTGGKAAIKTGKGVYRTGKGAVKAVKTIKNVGFKKAARQFANSARGKAVRTLQKAGGSLVNIGVDAAKKIGMKILLPVLVVFALATTIITSAGGAVAALMSPFEIFMGSGEVKTEDEWLRDEITMERSDMVDTIQAEYEAALVENGGEYHEVRFHNAFSDIDIPMNETNAETSLYSVQEYLECIQPIFHSLILSEYEDGAGENEWQIVFGAIWGNLTDIKTQELPLEYCNNGAVEPDGKIHMDKIVGCPNHSEIQYHSESDSACSCDYWYYECRGHSSGVLSCGKEEHTHAASCINIVEGEKVYGCGKEAHTHQPFVTASNPGCYGTVYHGTNIPWNCGNATRHKSCGGYYICNGHKILSMTVDIGNFDSLLDTYYRDEINELEAQESRTPEENERLQNLKDYYELCLNYMLVLQEEFGYGGGGGGSVSLEGVTLTEITGYACTFIGKPYVWGGNDPHTGADCSGFVKYVYEHFGATGIPRVAKDQVKVGVLVPSLEEALPGDLLFFSSDGTDSGVYHVAMYLGNGKMVHASSPKTGIIASNVSGVYKIKRIAQ